jgi:hypothetical protein
VECSTGHRRRFSKGRPNLDSDPETSDSGWFGNGCILSSFFSFILTSNKVLLISVGQQPFLIFLSLVQHWGVIKVTWIYHGKGNLNTTEAWILSVVLSLSECHGQWRINLLMMIHTICSCIPCMYNSTFEMRIRENQQVAQFTVQLSLTVCPTFNPHSLNLSGFECHWVINNEPRVTRTSWSQVSAQHHKFYNHLYTSLHLCMVINKRFSQWSYSTSTLLIHILYIINITEVVGITLSSSHDKKTCFFLYMFFFLSLSSYKQRVALPTLLQNDAFHNHLWM